MPPKIRYDREAVLQAAYRIARSQGAEAVNARAIARELGCSTQPIFRAFSGMEELRQELLGLARACYNSYMARSATLADKPYKGTGMAYILFAREEPHLFRMLFMRDRPQEGGGRGGELGEERAAGLGLFRSAVLQQSGDEGRIAQGRPRTVDEAVFGGLHRTEPGKTSGFGRELLGRLVAERRGAAVAGSLTGSASGFDERDLSAFFAKTERALKSRETGADDNDVHL